MTRWMFAPPLRELLGDLRASRARVGSKRRIVFASARAVAAQALGAAGQQQLQVGARVAVERGEDLVEVDVGQRLADRDPLALRQLAGRRACRA